jgi:hypothetical protein
VRWGSCVGEDGLDGTPGLSMTVLSAQALMSGAAWSANHTQNLSG